MRFNGFQSSLKKDGYKCARYDETINKINSILHKFLINSQYKINHKTYMTNSAFYGTQVQVLVNDVLIAQQYGKGVSVLKAEASGYAELLERVQLLYTFFSHNPYKQTLSFPYVKNPPLEFRQFNQHFSKIVKKNNPYLFEWEKEREKYVKVLDIFKREEAFLNYRFLYNPSGTASGNTYEEAFTQGLCEIFERFCVGYILMNQIQCPTIAKNLFSSQNQEYLGMLEENGIKIHIKDMSLNKGLPTIGLVYEYEDQKANKSLLKREKFHLQVGSATSMDIALERCLTETFQVQGQDEIRIKEGNIHSQIINKIYSTFPQLANIMPKDALLTHLYIKNAFIPEKNLIFLLKNTGSFNPWNFYSEDCLEEVNHLLNILKKNNFHCYVMDYSWLEFPTLLIIVPELHFGYNELIYETNSLRNFKKKVLFDFDQLTKKDLMILDEPRTLINIVIQKALLNRFLMIEVPKFKKISVWLFFGLLAKLFNLFETAEKYLSQLLPYFPDQIMIATQLSSKESIRNYLKDLLPTCNNACSVCKYEKDCKYSISKHFHKKILESFPAYFNLYKS